MNTFKFSDEDIGVRVIKPLPPTPMFNFHVSDYSDGILARARLPELKIGYCVDFGPKGYAASMYSEGSEISVINVY